jgi:hypothetical protein
MSRALQVNNKPPNDQPITRSNQRLILNPSHLTSEETAPTTL